MQIKNQLEPQSFHFTIDKPNMLVRSEEIRNLAEIDGYCKGINETINFAEELWCVEVEEGISLVDWLFSFAGEGNPEDRKFLTELMSKVNKTSSEMQEHISIALGQYGKSVYDLISYIETRREILQNITNPSEFGMFMPTCFCNSVFADDIIREIKNIKNFPEHTEEIVKNLAVLNDEAISLYEKYHNNLKIAMDILSSKLLECSPDSSHEDALNFTFSFEEIVNGENVARNKKVACSPHLKLIHPGSDLRIYFWWCDNQIGNGEKVLIGRIGSHPY